MKNAPVYSSKQYCSGGWVLVFVINILVLRICFGFRNSDFEFIKQKNWHIYIV
jgi:hypothetical protein